MLDRVKVALRISGNDTYGEIMDIIEAAVADLRLAGIKALPEDCTIETEYTPLVTRSVILYAKAHYGYSDDSEKYTKMYDDLKARLSMAGEFNGGIS